MKVRQDVGLQLRSAAEGVAINLQHLIQRHGIGGGVEVAHVGQQEFERVAHAAVGVHHAGEDFVVNVQVARVIGGGHPQAHDFRAHFVAHGLRLDGVAQRFAHFAALAVGGKTVGEQAFVGRAVKQGAAQQERAVEPATVLVVAF